jgi:glycosyltransferase involved in cell wall biosynthesis
LDLPDIAAFYAVFPDLPLISILDSQRVHLSWANWLATVHHGLPRDLLPFSPTGAGCYLAFLGRISPEKRPDWAIEIAARAEMQLKISAKVDRVDQVYWEQKFRLPVECHPNVEFIREISDHEKPGFPGNANALLFPVDWPEPFGL